MRCVFESSPAEFLAHTTGFRAADPVLTNVFTTLASARAEGRSRLEPTALWIRILSDVGETVGIALQTPPRGILLSPMPTAAALAVAESLVDLGTHVPGSDGPVGVTTAFAERYCALTGNSFAADLDQRILALQRVIPPRPTDGSVRAAAPNDRDTIVKWIIAFNLEAVPHQKPPAPAQIESKLSTPDTIWIWDVAGRPTSLCWQSVRAAGIIRISAVYTPPDERGHGYASANVAAASQRALEGGAVACMLYTDRLNPTSNKVYEAIGYEWVADAMSYAFTPGAGSPATGPEL